MTKHYFHATCRFCGKWEGDSARMVKYGVRHYAHHACYLDRKSLHDLHPWQIEQFPFKLLRERGLLDEAAACCKR